MLDSIRSKLITIFISLTIVPLLVLGVVLIWQNYIVEVNRTKKSLQQKTELAAENVTIFLHEQENKILSFLRTYHLPDMSLEEQKAHLAKFLTTSKDMSHGYIFDNIIVLDGDGGEILQVSRTHLVKRHALPIRAEPELYNKALQTGKIYYSSISFSKVTGEPVLETYAPIVDLRTQEPKEVLVAEMKLKFLWHLVSTIKIGNNGTAYLTDSNGRIIVHPNRSIVLKNTRMDIPETARIIPGVEGNDAVVVAREIRFGNLPLYFVTEIPKSEAFQHIYTSFYILGTILLLTLFSTIAIIVILVRQIVRPLESLATTARDISRGDYSQKAQLSNIKEFWELSHAFNAMTGRLRDTIENLESQIDFIENVFESLSHPLYVIDANDYTVKMANSAANFGMLTSDSKCYMLTHKTDVPCGGPDHPCTIDEIKKTGKPTMMQHLHCANRDGPKRIFEVYGYPIFNAAGEISQIIEYNIDVTEKKGLEDQLRQGQKLEAIGSLASGVAHDFNNLLTTILGYGELLLMKLAKDDPQRDRIEAIFEAGQKASTLTRQLLAFSRKQVLEMKVVSLNDLLKNLTKMLRRVIGEDVEIDMHLEPASGNIMADAGQIEQIVMNLAINARDALPTGGTITIETQRVSLDEEYCKHHAEASPGKYVALYITDNGTGMSAEVMEKIFDPFFTTKAKGTGTGLGLSTVYGIVKQHNGHIYVYSEMGRGTTFKIYFPEVQKAADDNDTETLPNMEGGTETILVADDETSIRKLVRDTLEPLGYSVIEATDGEEALELFNRSESKIDLLFTDVIMPKMTGKKLAETLLAQHPQLKVLYMSGYTDNVIVHQGVLDSHVEFINKPLVPSVLTKKIREVLAK
jgi:signal transduction histidine kinase